MTAGSLTHRTRIDRLIVRCCGIPECSGSEINKSGHTPDKREGYIITRHILFTTTPLCLLHTKDALDIHDIRISSVYSCRLTESMIIEHQMRFGTTVSNTISHLRGSLVVTIHKINLKSFNTHLRILFTSCIKLLIQYVEDAP